MFKKYFKNFILIALLVLFVFALAAPAGLATNDTDKEGLWGLTETAEKAGLIPKGEADQIPGPAALIGTIVGYVLVFVGVIFFVLMIYGGFVWMTARGKEELVKKAKDTIETAAIGLVVIFLAYTVTNFILSQLAKGAGVVPTP